MESSPSSNWQLAAVAAQYCSHRIDSYLLCSSDGRAAIRHGLIVPDQCALLSSESVLRSAAFLVDCIG